MRTQAQLIEDIKYQKGFLIPLESEKRLILTNLKRVNKEIKHHQQVINMLADDLTKKDQFRSD